MRKKRNEKFLFLLELVSLVMFTGCSFIGNSMQSSDANEKDSSVSNVSENSVESIVSVESSSVEYYELYSSSEEYFDNEPRDFIPDETYDFMDGINKIMNEATDIEELKERVEKFDKEYNRVHHISVFTGDHDYHDIENRVEVTEGELRDGMVVVVYSDENTPSWTKTLHLFMDGLWKILDDAATVEGLKEDLEEFDKDYNRIHHTCVFADNDTENRIEITEGEITDGMVIVVYSDENTTLWESDW